MALPRKHFGIPGSRRRGLADRPQARELEIQDALTIILAERTWELPAGIFRPDVVDTIWHLDLPDFHERCEIWELAAGRHGLAPREFDQVVLSRASHESTQADSHAAFIRAARARHPHPPKEKHLLEALSELQPVARARHDELARMTLLGEPLCGPRTLKAGPECP